jgi:allantoin racemase
MRILVINPNTTEAMTCDIEAQARRYAHPESEVEAISPRWGPASIEGHLEDELAAVATLEAVAERAGDYDGVIIACYGDPGLYAAREVSPVPVVGIAEASMLMACMIAHRFSVVTVLPRIKPLIEDVVARYGLSGRCASVRATSLAVLEIERDPDAAQREITAEASKAITADGAEAICLGCAGMGPLDRHVQEALDVPVIDGVAAAVKMLEALNGYGVATSRVAAFKRPEPKELTGETDVLRAFRAGTPTAEPLRT